MPRLITYTARTALQIIILLCMFNNAPAADIIILSSNDIIPYNTCIKGIKDSLHEFSLQIFNMEESLQKGKQILADIEKNPPDLVIAVGPQAAYLLADKNLPKIFCMVLNPLKIIGQNNTYPGISLNIPPSFQLNAIAMAFPDRKTVGVFFSQKSNKQTIEGLQHEASKRQLVLKPLEIVSASDIPKIINSNSFLIDILLIIPDSMIKSKKIVEYIIKESLLKKIPVVGYNSWFAKNGALLSFVVDYEKAGVQTGLTGKRIISKTPGIYEILPPEKIRINVDLKTAKKLGVTISPNIIKQADEVVK